MGQRIKDDILGTPSHLAGVITVTPSLVMLGGRQYYTGTLTRTITSDVVLTVNGLFFVYIQVVAGVVVLRVSLSSPSAYKGANPTARLVTAFYADHTQTFYHFVGYTAHTTVRVITGGGGTYTTPPLARLRLQMVGGGAGGGGSANQPSSAGGGGGAGQYHEKHILSPLATYAYSVAAAVAGGTVGGTNGTTGNSTTFGTFTAFGGGPGTGSANATLKAGGVGGTGAGNGDAEVQGGYGGNGYHDGAQGTGGIGGASYFGSGGYGGENTNLAPANALAPGSGGGGGGANGGAQAGGNGAPGIIIIEERKPNLKELEAA